MNFIDRWFLKRIFKKISRQSNHSENTLEVFQMIRHAWEMEFTEDNDPTMDATLREIFEKTLKTQDESYEELKDQLLHIYFENNVLGEKLKELSTNISFKKKTQV